MKETTEPDYIRKEKDLVLREVWRAKREFAAERGFDLQKLFLELREKEKQSGLVVNFSEREKTNHDRFEEKPPGPV